MFDCPDDMPFYIINQSAVVAIINGNYSNLDDEKEKQIDSWLNSVTNEDTEGPRFIGCCGASQGITECDITGLMANCYKVW